MTGKQEEQQIVKTCPWHAKGLCAYSDPQYCNKKHPQTGERYICPREEEAKNNAGK